MMKKGYDLLNDPFLNKGTAFTEAEREQYSLVGILPPTVQSLENQAKQAYENIENKPNVTEKRHYLMNIFSRNRTLFFYVFKQHIAEFMPIVYDPGIAESIREYSEFFITPQNAAYLSIDHPERMEESIRNASEGRDIDLIVVTDAEAILGIGDWGTNGVSISVGKLMVYTAAAGLDPARVLPVVLDAGTNRESLLKNPLYLGLHQKRIIDGRYDAFVDQFVKLVEGMFPRLYLHFEDFGREHAAKILDRYVNTYPVFNDDIEGTGIISLAGILGGLNISGEKLTDQVYMCFGAGTAGCGIAKRIYQEMLDQGLSEDEARKRFYLVDRQGLLFDDMDDLTPEQKPFARKRSEFANASELTNLTAAVKAVHPTILVGTSTKSGAFTEEIVKEMASYAKRPIIFPLSNPTELAEATAEDLIRWTDGCALVATGIPSAPVIYNGVTYDIGQANNALIYPGLGLGVIASGAKLLTDRMISVAAHSIGGIVDPTKPGASVLPPVTKLDQFSETVACAVAAEAKKEGLNRNEVADPGACVKAYKWEPRYK
ncbi:MAG: NAD-dependent malic enzyme [Acidaminococcus sp.]|jgi:malate dehydrogenase (oxaloacetate-decarboxylating)|nr:NAD-dependent malic enzyme [Acidaminococcus sp.]MCI2099774.1 NAD-dependent malic enzyme [Acidaminococcus sp.]MCI2113956.1 NAD-dependent malic enzyme [Acidaminococcus sp.]MCI2117087.1 NAD-dependent malic enzyme [Acidaminococcus sp.]